MVSDVERAVQLPADAPDHRPFAPASSEFRLRVGTRAIDVDAWLTVDAARDAELALKARLAREHHDEVVAVLDGAEAAAEEVLDAVVHSLAADHGLVVEPDRSLHPVDAAGRLVQEDLCLLLERDDALLLVAASVCFPQEWDLREKLGRPLAAIHGPVPGYGASLAAPVDRMLRALRPGRVLERSNWSVNVDPARFQLRRDHVDPGSISPTNAGERCWLRVERQTLRRFPAHGGVCFTIRTYQRRLDALAHDRQACAHLATSIRALPPRMAAYKGLDVIGATVLAWLDARAR